MRTVKMNNKKIGLKIEPHYFSLIANILLI